jgi:hypothetical protein
MKRRARPARLAYRRHCDTALMTALSVALANLKPGTGKTTSAVWLAHVFAQAGNSVLLVDADPSGSALEWSDLAAMYPGLRAAGGVPVPDRGAALAQSCTGACPRSPWTTTW